ncbi:NAD-dependent epimerase/dehydratase family protein [Dokdonia sp. Hel_I_53]|uniref:NAD-dependent epimerase/dehydratase family protein n=1 Tax=Dokdonia sp. Hel_I_53 TaxID=1566287 RepID=UPI00119B6C23|nr:NAD-dependent epimerase/dehydratase family protein [Dokdonia sp. Hel_I_53]TVZ51935.1 UDP-glucose 4-epimerase [Dokdonia sp. Hel_I_53]
MQYTSLVTGGAGFIGSHVASYLLQHEHKVVVLDDLSGGFEENIPEECLFIKGSVTDYQLVNELFNTHVFDYVYHLAAYAAEGLSHFIRRFNYENNVIGSINLINASVNHAVKKFIFTSSIAVYGSQELPLRESQNPQPEDPYGIAKYAVEMDLKNAHEMFGLDYIIFRPHNVYGPGQNIGDKYRNVVGIFMNQILKKEALTIFGDGKQTRAFTYIDDVAPYIAASYAFAKADNQIFNIGSDIHHTVQQLAEEVNKAMSSSTQITHLKERNEVQHAYADHCKFEDIFEPAVKTTLEDGLKVTARWVIDKGSRESQPFQHIEIKKNLPPSWQ